MRSVEHNLHHHFTRVEKWIPQSKAIEQDIEVVTGVAPIGAPNSYSEGFGESRASMNLQVIGNKVTRHLTIRSLAFHCHALDSV